MKRWSDRSPLTLIHVGVDTSITSTWPMIESMSPLCPKSSASLPRVSGRFSTCVLHTDFTSSAVIRLHLTFRQLEVDPIVDPSSTRCPARAALRPEDPRRSTGVCPAFPIGFRGVFRRPAKQCANCSFSFYSFPCIYLTFSASCGSSCIYRPAGISAETLALSFRIPKSRANRTLGSRACRLPDSDARLCVRTR